MDARIFNVYIHNKDMILTSISCLYIYTRIQAGLARGPLEGGFNNLMR